MTSVTFTELHGSDIYLADKNPMIYLKLELILFCC